jgi:hypothetical protein
MGNSLRDSFHVVAPILRYERHHPIKIIPIKDDVLRASDNATIDFNGLSALQPMLLYLECFE